MLSSLILSGIRGALLEAIQRRSLAERLDDKKALLALAWQPHNSSISEPGCRGELLGGIPCTGPGWHRPKRHSDSCGSQEGNLLHAPGRAQTNLQARKQFGARLCPPTCFVVSVFSASSTGGWSAFSHNCFTTNAIIPSSFLIL